MRFSSFSYPNFILKIYIHDGVGSRCIEAMIVYFGFFGTIFFLSFSFAAVVALLFLMGVDIVLRYFCRRHATSLIQNVRAHTHRAQTPRPRQRSNISYFYFNMLKVKRWLWEKRNTEYLVAARPNAPYFYGPFGCHHACHAIQFSHFQVFLFTFFGVSFRMPSQQHVAVVLYTTTISVVAHWKCLNFIFIIKIHGAISSYWEQVPFHSTRSPRIRIINHEKSLFFSFVCEFCVQNSKIYAIIAHNDETF